VDENSTVEEMRSSKFETPRSSVGHGATGKIFDAAISKPQETHVFLACPMDY